MSSVTYLRLAALIYIVQCAPMWFDCTKTVLKNESNLQQ